MADPARSVGQSSDCKFPSLALKSGRSIRGLEHRRTTIETSAAGRGVQIGELGLIGQGEARPKPAKVRVVPLQSTFRLIALDLRYSNDRPKGQMSWPL